MFCHILPPAKNMAFLFSKNVKAKEWHAYPDFEGEKNHFYRIDLLCRFSKNLTVANASNRLWCVEKLGKRWFWIIRVTKKHVCISIAIPLS